MLKTFNPKNMTICEAIRPIQIIKQNLFKDSFVFLLVNVYFLLRIQEQILPAIYPRGFEQIGSINLDKLMKVKQSTKTQKKPIKIYKIVLFLKLYLYLGIFNIF